MLPTELRLKNGLQCISVDEEDKTVSIIVPEGWRLEVMAVDSGLTFDVDRKGTSPGTDSFVTLTPRRVAAKPVVRGGDDSGTG